MLNALTGFLSWQALGRPEWMTPASLGERVERTAPLPRGAVDGLEPDLRAVTRDAVLRFKEGILRLSRETFKSGKFRGYKSGRFVAVLNGQLNREVNRRCVLTMFGNCSRIGERSNV